MTSGAQSTPRRGSGQLGPDWVPGADGILFRNAARLIVVDESDRVLMVRGHDIDDPGRRWWFTVGGGIDPGESPREAAVRELAEETGLCVDTDELVGPVLTRRAEFDFVRQTVRQDEVFFFARVASPGEITTDGWTDVEQRFMDEVRWWHLDDLADVSHQVYPEGFVDLVKGLLGGRKDVARASGDRSGESVGQSGSVIDGVPHP